ncbi:helix-turn-helix domain-containing protein [Actinocrispum sp. NPDC049592]|uniref:helix-turn-helix domain-containing protein n=1 Tax=Actinocrispum sp. NPDC049592 TaxID=3154835 RepID=UPI00343A8BE4
MADEMREARLRRKKTLKQVSDDLHYSVSTISRKESGISKLDGPFIQQYCEFLGISRRQMLEWMKRGIAVLFLLGGLSAVTAVTADRPRGRETVLAEAPHPATPSPAAPLITAASIRPGPPPATGRVTSPPPSHLGPPSPPPQPASAGTRPAALPPSMPTTSAPTPPGKGTGWLGYDDSPAIELDICVEAKRSASFPVTVSGTTFRARIGRNPHSPMKARLRYTITVAGKTTTYTVDELEPISLPLNGATSITVRIETLATACGVTQATIVPLG